jgi:hydroxypyruvate reductase
LREQAESIWRAGVEAVDSETLVGNVVQRSGETLIICGHELPLARWNRIAVVGAGKAGGGMAAAFENAVGQKVLKEKVTGWINVPADCLRPLERIHLHAARPAGVNEPTAEGVLGSEKILEAVALLGPDDLCVVLISGGGSALLPAPASAISLDDKQEVTRLLMRSGATIDELNCVRKQLSRIKGGRLARATRAGLVLTLIISDVVDDPLDVIASGPTVADSSTPQEALEVLEKYASGPHAVPQRVLDYLSGQSEQDWVPTPLLSSVQHHVIGNNGVALAASTQQAEALGYRVHSLGSDNRGVAREEGTLLADSAVSVRNQGKPEPAPLCILSGGEPVVHLAKTDKPRRGGRNQELVLAALAHLRDAGLSQIALLSGGTDGEDGPTDAAGAVADEELLNRAKAAGLDPQEFLEINNSYPFFERTGGLLKTGPTHTNVMDLRVVLIAKE